MIVAVASDLAVASESTIVAIARPLRVLAVAPLSLSLNCSAHSNLSEFAVAPPSVKRARSCLQGLIPPPAYHHLANSQAGNLAANWNFVQIKCSLDAAVTTVAEKVIDLNLSAGTEEMDLLAEMVRPTVISPRPIRPVGSTVVVERISDDIQPREAAMGVEEVEEMVEAVEAPAFVSDS